MQGADGSEGKRVGGASGAASGGQQESGFDKGQGDLTLPELTGEAQVMATEAARRVGQPEIEIEQNLAISLRVGGMGGSFRFLVSCEPRLQVGFRGRVGRCFGSG